MAAFAVEEIGLPPSPTRRMHDSVTDPADAGERNPVWRRLTVELYRLVAAMPSRVVKAQDRLDIAHAVFLRLSLQEQTGPRCLDPRFLARCLRNAAIDFRRRQQCRCEANVDTDLESLPDPRTSIPRDPKLEAVTHPMALLIEAALGSSIRLTALQERILELRCAGVSIHAISTIVDRSRAQIQATIKAVRSRCSRRPHADPTTTEPADRNHVTRVGLVESPAPPAALSPQND